MKSFHYWILAAIILLVVLITVGLIIADAYQIGYETGKNIVCNCR